MRLRSSDKPIRIPAPVPLHEAEAARARSPVWKHPVLPDCFSCGTNTGSMKVQAGAAARLNVLADAAHFRPDRVRY